MELVQTTIDPLQNAGEGVGIAPIGHVVKVYGVENETVNLSFTLTYQQEWGWEDVKTYVETTIKAYFTELAQTWADQEQPLVVRVSQIESRLLAVSGILDIAIRKSTEQRPTMNWPLIISRFLVLLPRQPVSRAHKGR